MSVAALANHHTLASYLTMVGMSILATLACASAPRGPDDGGRAPNDRAQETLARAIAYAGGERALAHARALTWDGDAVVHVGGRDIAITGTWRIQPPDTAIVATYAVANAPSTTRSMIVAAPRGWTEANGTFTPLTPTVLANEREEFYLYAVMRLLPLRDPGVTLFSIPPDSAGNDGIGVRAPGRPEVDAYFEKSGRMAWLRTTVVHPLTSAQAKEEMTFAGRLTAGGIAWPQELHIMLDRTPYFDLTMKNLGVAPRLGDAVLNGPR